MDVRKRPEAVCGRGRRQKRTPFSGTLVGLIEPVPLVKVRRAGDIESHRHGPRETRLQWGGPRDPTGSQVFPVGKKRDLYREKDVLTVTQGTYSILSNCEANHHAETMLC